MAIGDPEGRIFLSHPHTNNRPYFLLTTFYLIYIGKKPLKRPLEIPEYAEMRHGDVILHYIALRIDVRPSCSCSFFIFPKGLYGSVRYLTWVKTREIPIFVQENCIQHIISGRYYRQNTFLNEKFEYGFPPF